MARRLADLVQLGIGDPARGGALVFLRPVFAHSQDPWYQAGRTGLPLTERYPDYEEEALELFNTPISPR